MTESNTVVSGLQQIKQWRENKPELVSQFMEQLKQTKDMLDLLVALKADDLLKGNTEYAGIVKQLILSAPPRQQMSKEDKWEKVKEFLNLLPAGEMKSIGEMQKALAAISNVSAVVIEHFNAGDLIKEANNPPAKPATYALKTKNPNWKAASKKEKKA